MSTIKARNFHLIEDLDIAAIAYGLVERFEAAADKVVGTFRVWTSRSRDRQQLGRMSDRMMQDIGLTRADVELELNKYFWQK
jgi:uncharacterized protein YjiS (DUF1127 family)